MKNTLTFILKKIVEFPDEIEVFERQGDTRIIFEVHANEKDIGKIIGKNGRIIHGIRDLIKLMAAKENAYVDVVIAEVA